jgi:hypothetical protein
MYLPHVFGKVYCGFMKDYTYAYVFYDNRGNFQMYSAYEENEYHCLTPGREELSVVPDIRSGD